MLEIRNLHAAVEGAGILKGLDLTVPAGEVHAIMGPNGSGKSTLSYVLAGREGYDVTHGEVRFAGQDLLALSTEERAGEGLFLAFQYPVEIPGVPNSTFLREAMNAVRRYRGTEELDAMQFLKRLKEVGKTLGVGDEMIKRGVNVGFSGGEKKRNEVLQMLLLEPKFAVLDETDSGLDVDALKTVAGGVNAFRGPKRGILVITHYQRLLDYIVPDIVHILAGGRIQRSGDASLAREVEAEGYARYLDAAA